ncbi:MAG: PEP-CTERM sorting domain-containing protein [Planctomycetota bacterium]|nr:MAG: PEP-CTERM sorting domain-containing protein [Planctomycetota bacterium]
MRGPEALAGGVFDASALELERTAGNLDANLSGFADIAESVDISGNMALNSSGGSGYTTPINGTHYVYLPINLEVVIPVEISPGVVLPITAAFTGQVVTVPEPSSLALLGVACAVVPAVGYRRLRRRA